MSPARKEDGVNIELDDEYKITSDAQEYKLRYITDKKERIVAHCSTLEYALHSYIDRKEKLSGAESVEELQTAIKEAHDAVDRFSDKLRGKDG